VCQAKSAWGGASPSCVADSEEEKRRPNASDHDEEGNFLFASDLKCVLDCKIGDFVGSCPHAKGCKSKFGHPFLVRCVGGGSFHQK